MSTPSLNRRQLLASLGALAAAPCWAAGEIAGGKAISLIVSYPAGGGADVMARLIAPRLAEALGQPVVVENKPGASGTLAAGQVARATPDGSTLLLDASSFAVNPALFAKLPYDTETAFTPLAVLALYPNVLVCTPSFEARSVADVLRLAKAKPGALAYASSGNGSAQHLAGALFEQLGKVDLNHVPYRGGGPALTDVMGGQVPLFFANVASSLTHIQAGRLRPLAVTAAVRCRALPDVPTMAEAGVKGHEVLEWNPVLAPAGLPPATRDKLVTALRKAMGDPEVLGRVRTLGGDVFAGDPAVFLKGQLRPRQFFAAARADGFRLQAPRRGGAGRHGRRGAVERDACGGRARCAPESGVAGRRKPHCAALTRGHAGAWAAGQTVAPAVVRSSPAIARGGRLP